MKHALAITAVFASACSMAYDRADILVGAPGISAKDVETRAYEFAYQWADRHKKSREDIDRVMSQLEIKIHAEKDLNPSDPNTVRHGLWSYNDERPTIDITANGLQNRQTLEHELVHFLLWWKGAGDKDHQHPDWEWLHGCEYKTYQTYRGHCPR